MRSYALVVPVFNRLEKTRTFVEQFRRLDWPEKRLIITDDGSTDGTTEYLRDQPDVEYVRGTGDLWWSGGTNAAVERALEGHADRIVTVNDDAVIESDWLQRLDRTVSEKPGDVICATILIAGSEVIWSAGASYHNVKTLLYSLNLNGIQLGTAKRLFPQTFEVEVSPGNGVCYPSWVFRKWGFFPMEDCPQYHGDTHFNFRLAERGVPLICDLNWNVWNDLDQHSTIVNKYSVLESRRSPHYLPAVYHIVKEREGESAALSSAVEYVAAFSDDPELRLASRAGVSKLDFHLSGEIVKSVSADKPVGFYCGNGLSLERVDRTFPAWRCCGSGKLELFFKRPIQSLGKLAMVFEDIIQWCPVVMATPCSIQVDLNFPKCSIIQFLYINDSIQAYF